MPSYDGSKAEKGHESIPWPNIWSDITMSIYASACQECLDRNRALRGTSAPSTDYWFWCVRDASCRKAAPGKLGLCEGFQTGEFCVQSDFYKEGTTGGIGLNCSCTSCTDPGCMRDYVDPSCKPLYSDCGCGSVSGGGRQTVGNDPKNRLWTRGDLVCEFRARRVVGDGNYSPPGTSSFVSIEELDMRRKAETLLHRNNSARLTAKQKWSQMVRGKGPLGPKAWASQTQTVTIPNVRPCGKQSAFCSDNPTDPACGGCLPPNPKKPETSLICTGPGPTKCSPNTAADVPRSPVPELNLLCMDKSVPLTRYGRPSVVLSSAGTKWPGGGWAPGMNGFPVGKAGSNAFERRLARDSIAEIGTSLENQSFKIKLPYFPGGADGSRANRLTRCNRFAMSGVELTVCVRNGVATVPNIQDNEVSFLWRPSDKIPYDPHGIGLAGQGAPAGDGIKPGAGLPYRDTVLADLRLFKHSSCTAESEWEGVPWSENGAQDEEGEPGGAPTVREPAQMSTWCRGVLELACSNLEEGSGDRATPPNFSKRTCCGGGDLVSEGQYTNGPPIGKTRYTGALAWASSPEATRGDTDSNKYALPVPPPAMSPWGQSHWVYSSNDWCDASPVTHPQSGPAVFAGSSTQPQITTAAATDWTSNLGTPVGPPGYVGRGCGQPITLGGKGYPIKLGDPDCNFQGCKNQVAYQAKYANVGPEAEPGKQDARKIQYPERYGGNWNPAVYKCDSSAQNNSLKTASGAALTADGKYVTITWNFGAFCSAHPVSGGCDSCVNDPRQLNTLQGGMGQWLPWVDPEVPATTNEPLESPDQQGRGGMVPELYTFTWYIDAASLASAEASEIQVPCFGIVTGKPSSGQLIDPRPCMGGYVSKDDKYVDYNLAGGGWLGRGGSVVGTRAGGLGLRGCLKYPVCDVWGESITVELCQ